MYSIYRLVDDTPVFHCGYLSDQKSLERLCLLHNGLETNYDGSRNADASSHCVRLNRRDPFPDDIATM